jgi:hypothetical protein
LRTADLAEAVEQGHTHTQLHHLAATGWRSCAAQSPPSLPAGRWRPGTPRVVGAVRANAGDGLVCGDLRQQLGQHGRVAGVVAGDFNDFNEWESVTALTAEGPDPPEWSRALTWLLAGFMGSRASRECSKPLQRRSMLQLQVQFQSLLRERLLKRP